MREHQEDTYQDIRSIEITRFVFIFSSVILYFPIFYKASCFNNLER